MRRFLPVLLLAFAVDSLLVFWLGDSGLVSFRSLAAYRSLLRSNVENLDAIGVRLDAELAGLRDSSAGTEVLAREIGLFREGDRVIRVQGGPDRHGFQEVGKLVRPPRQGSPRDPVLKGAGLGLAVLLSALLVVLRRLLRKGEHGDHTRRRP